MRDDQLVRHLPLLAPPLDERQRVEVEVQRAGRARPVPHARHHEEPHRLADRALAHRGHHAVVVVDGDFRRHGGVVPALDQEQLAAAREVSPQVRVHGVHRLDLGAVRRRDVAVEVQRARPVVPVRIAEHVVLEELHRDAQRLRAAGQLAPAQLAARIERRVDLGAGARVARAAVDLPRRLDLRRRSDTRSSRRPCTARRPDRTGRPRGR